MWLEPLISCTPNIPLFPDPADVRIVTLIHALLFPEIGVSSCRRARTARFALSVPIANRSMFPPAPYSRLLPTSP